ncbi:MAG: histidine kinase [Acidobacteriota bacterium]
MVWLLPGLYFAIQVYLQRTYEKQPIGLTQALLQGLVFWLLWALSSPIILWLARAFPFGREQWPDALLLHLPAGTIFSLAHLLLFVIITSWLAGNPPGSFDELLARFQPVFLSSFAWWSLVYWTILIASYAFHYYERYQHGALRSTQLEMQLAQAELRALRMQLHPHFLFNTLHSISALMHQDVETADKMVARLGEFLRMTLNNAGSSAITLEEEIKFLECYLEIERLRFEDRLTILFEIDPTIRMARVPNLIMQPIVENAIRHGIAPLTGHGRLTIRVRKAGPRLRLEVEDNGPGLSAEKVSQLMEMKGPSEAVASASGNGHGRIGLGLANTRARLTRFYGAEQRIVVENLPEGGLAVILEIPLLMENDDA